LIATLSISTISDITTTGAVGVGTITFDGGADVIGSGICWGTTTAPTVADAKAVIGDLPLLKVFAGTTMTPLLIKIRMVHYITRIQLFQVSSVR